MPCPSVFVRLVADNCNLNGPALYCGGDLDANANYGAFYLNANDASNHDANIGARLIVWTHCFCFMRYGFSTPIGENTVIRTGLSSAARKAPRQTRRVQILKRKGNLLPALISDENIRRAIREVNRTHRYGRHHRKNRCVAWVEQTEAERVEELRHILRDGFPPSAARRRQLYDQSSRKWREIYEPKLWPDQYVHHALVQVIQPIILRRMDRWCCGSIPGRGPHYGARAIKRWMRTDHKGTRYCATLDIRHFYQSLTPETVMERIGSLIKDRRVLALCRETLADGVPIGSYCSQWYANAVLEPLDQYIHTLAEVRHYTRYMDNMTLFGPNKRKLRRAVAGVSAWLERHGLSLNGSRQIFPVRARMPDAMGYRYGRGYTLLRKRTVLRFKRACRRAYRRISGGQKPTVRQAMAIMSRAGALRHCNGEGILRVYLAPLGIRRLKSIIRREAVVAYGLHGGDRAALPRGA